jgi:Flp pilus assembly protein TadD
MKRRNRSDLTEKTPAGSPGQTTPTGTRPEAAIWPSVAVCGLLLLAVVLVFGQTVGFDFVNFDDNYYVYDNPHLAPSLSGQDVLWAFTATDAGNWHPLTWLSYMLDYQLYGPKPWGYHLTNVLLHAATAITLFLVLRRMTGDFWPSAFVAAVFAVHPLRAESVAWVSERKDVLSGLFFMLTLAAYVGYVRRPFSLARYSLVAVLFALGLMAKPILVTLPFVLLLLDYWPLGRIALPIAGNLAGGWGGSCTATPGATGQLSPQQMGRLLVEKLPLLALSGASCVATSVAQEGALVRLDFLPLGVRAANALISYVTYVGQFFYPLGLAVFYPHHGDKLAGWAIVGALLLLSGICVAAVVWRRRCPYVFVGWYWYVGMLVPVIGLVQVGLQAMADRYTYLPQIGLAVALAWGAKRAFASWPHRGRLLGGASALGLVALMGCAFHQTSFWRNSETLWNRATESTRDNAVAYANLGADLTEQGRTAEAIVQIEKALAIQPDYADAHNNLGMALAHCQRVDEAITQYRKALELNPDFADAHNNLGNTLARNGRLDEAIIHLRRALELKPDFAKVHNNLGSALHAMGRDAEAIVHLRTATELNPGVAECHYNLANALAKLGQYEEMEAEYQKALELKPGYVQAHNNLGAALLVRGRLDEGIGEFEAALKTKPDYTEARNNLGFAQLQRQEILKALAGRRELLRARSDDITLLNETAWVLATNPNASIRNGAEAVELAGRAAQLSGGREPAVLDTLAAAYAEAGRFSEAVQTARKAMELATRQNNRPLAESINAKISLYETRTPFREMSRPPAAGSIQP